MKTTKIDPLLSVIVPIYNVATTLDRCLLFLINQSFDSIEIICIDDCSTDKSRDIIFSYQNKYPEKIIYAKTNVRCGPGEARNHGLALARGRYVGFVDGDDWVDSSLYSVVMDQVLMQDADIAVFGVKNEYGNPSSSHARYVYPHINCIDQDFALRLLTRTHDNNVFISPMVCQKVYRRSFLQEHSISFHSSSYFEDDLFSFRCFLYKSKIIIVPGVYYHYYQRSDSITHTFSQKHIEDLISLIGELKKCLITENRWDTNRQDYYAFCDKCIHSMINSLFIAEPTIQSQKRYISYLIAQLQKQITIDEWLDYMDIQAVKRIFMM